MGNKNTRISFALLMVVSSLLMASLACYSGQIPGVLELTPYYTETPLPVPENPRFDVGDEAFTAREKSPFFNLTDYPEPLDRSLTNSKAMCETNAAARVLYVGTAADGDNYYLVECGGSAGWAVENRLAGPLIFFRGELAMALAKEGARMVEMLDPSSFQPMFLQTCQPGTIVSIVDVQAQDTDDDGSKELYYQVECPPGNRGWLTNEDLFGPLEIDVGNRALAIGPAGGGTDYQLASEPAPLTDENAISGDCPYGAVIQATEAQFVEDAVYFKVTCGEVEGWTTQDNFIGPLLYDPDSNMVIYVPPIPVFADALPEDAQGLAVASVDETAEGGDEAAAGEDAAEGEEIEIALRDVLQYVPPLYLAETPGPAISEGEDANVVGQCTSGGIAKILAHMGQYSELQELVDLDTVYYQIECQECVETDVTADGEVVCSAYEPRQGWVSQAYLKGPITFIPGDRAIFDDTGAVDEDGNPVALIPAQPTYVVGENTRFSGRCPLEDGVEIVSVRLEKDRTRNAFSFYYEVQCTGDAAVYTEVEENNAIRNVVSFNTGHDDTVMGWATSRDMGPIE
ncbi:MAG: hypothetical protein JXJ20_08265 [Anaerolineae bacterium]|nr:hypothetical protein [Anaerolineae bacterium]